VNSSQPQGSNDPGIFNSVPLRREATMSARKLASDSENQSTTKRAQLGTRLQPSQGTQEMHLDPTQDLLTHQVEFDVL